ncbi:hypothetical protein BG011_006434 [Mortierella polycephala]|uniref:MYND-type domain-containing protein n=1 Tax=Mortierella polycephala TaxID=41804 RepID=A0A9P6TZ02_9FUNG|nr:hypothetical protein BG011_006434 [Mortierella polycephala]
MAIIEEYVEPTPAAAATPGSTENIEPFLGLSREQCHILLALYHVVDPSLEPAVPVLFPEMAKKFAEDRKERNSVAKKLERSPEVFTEEVLNLQETQKAVAMALMESDMDQDKARQFLKMKSKEETLANMDTMTVQETLMNGILLGGIREAQHETPSGKKSSPLSSPTFREAKKFYDLALEKFKFSMAGVQLGSFYLHEFQDCKGENCLEGEDPEQVSLEYYLKAAELGNPMAIHKVAWYYDQKGDWHKAIEWYNKSADNGYPDSAHNLGMIYQEGNPKVEPVIEQDLPKAIDYYSRAVTYGYGPSGTELGKLFFKMSTDEGLRENLPSSNSAYSSDPKEYLMTAISWFDKAATVTEWEALQLLGMIYGSQNFGLYDLERSQNLFELTLIVSNGRQGFEFLCRTLSARRTLIAEELARQEAGAGPSDVQEIDSTGLKTCAANNCNMKETKKDEFQRCAGCKKKFYCSRLCQVNDWKERHKKNCKK